MVIFHLGEATAEDKKDDRGAEASIWGRREKGKQSLKKLTPRQG